MISFENIKILSGEVKSHNFYTQKSQVSWETTKNQAGNRFKKDLYNVEVNLKVNSNGHNNTPETLVVCFDVINLYKYVANGSKETKSWRITLRDTTGYLNNETIDVPVDHLMNVNKTFLSQASESYKHYLESEATKLEEQQEHLRQLEEKDEIINRKSKDLKEIRDKYNTNSELLFKSQQENIKKDEIIYKKDEIINTQVETINTQVETINTQAYEITVLKQEVSNLRTSQVKKENTLTLSTVKELLALIPRKGISKAIEIINEKYFN